MPHAWFGLAGRPRKLDDQEIRDAAERGVPTALGLDLSQPQQTGGKPVWRVIAIGNKRYIAVTSANEPPSRLFIAIERHTASRPAPATNTAMPLRIRDTLSASGIVSGCKARLFRYASLFALDCSALLDHVAARCPHSDAATALDELGSAVLGIIGDFGVCLRIDTTRLLCGFYSHTKADPELIASQMLITLRKATCTAEIMLIQPGRYFLLDASHDDAEQECASFIDGL